MSEEILSSAEPSPWVSPDGAIGEGAPENVTTLFEKKGWGNINDLITGYSELEKFKGLGDDNHIVLPEGDDPQMWDKVWNRLGRPETHDKYAFEYDGDVEVSDDLLGDFRQTAHSLGLSQKQFEAIVNWQVGKAAAQLEAESNAHNESIENNVKLLKEKFGEKDYESKVREARMTADKLGIYETLEKKGLASDADMIGVLATLAANAREDTLKPQSQDTGGKSAEAELREIEKSEAFTDKFHRDHKETHKRFMELCVVVENQKRAG